MTHANQSSPLADQTSANTPRPAATPSSDAPSSLPPPAFESPSYNTDRRRPRPEPLLSPRTAPSETTAAVRSPAIRTAAESAAVGRCSGHRPARLRLQYIHCPAPEHPSGRGAPPAADHCTPAHPQRHPGHRRPIAGPHLDDRRRTACPYLPRHPAGWGRPCPQSSRRSLPGGHSWAPGRGSHRSAVGSQLDQRMKQPSTPRLSRSIGHPKHPIRIASPRPSHAAPGPSLIGP